MWLTRTLVATALVCALLSLAPSVSSQEAELEYPSFDGFYHNIAAPDWGAAERHMIRISPAAYEDGVGEPSGFDRPNPRDISQATMSGKSGQGSSLNRTAFLVHFGQQVVEELLDIQRPGCIPEYINIDIKKDDPLYGGIYDFIPVTRSRYDFTTGQSPGNPRQQLNEISPWIDGTLMYGPSKGWCDALRSFKDGRLAESRPGFPLENDIGLPIANPPVPVFHKLLPAHRFYRIGNPRTNENPMLLAMALIWFRNHNFHASRLKAEHPTWKDEKLFMEARKWTIAEHQNIVLNHWLPAWLNDTIPEYKGYQPHVIPAISHEFQTAAMRFGHTLVTPGIYRRDAQCRFYNTTSINSRVPNKPAMRTCNTYFRPRDFLEETDDGLERIIMGMASQLSEREDSIVTEDLRGFVFGPLEASRRDLMAINIQRARDHGVADYNTIRKTFGLPAVANFSQITSNETIARALEKVYGGDISKIDLWAGGLAETTLNGPGPLFNAILKDQFLRIRDGDRFWFANTNNRLFTQAEIERIQNTTIYDIVIRVTDIPPSAIQRDMFHHLATDPCPQPKQLSQDDLEECTPPQVFDYFQDSGSDMMWTFLFGAFGWVFFVLLVLGYIVKFRNRTAMNLKITQPTGTVKRNRPPADVPADEFPGGLFGALMYDETVVPVLIEIDSAQLIIRSRVRVIIREFDLRRIASMELCGEYLLLMIPEEYDLMLSFTDSSKTDHFLRSLATAVMNLTNTKLKVFLRKEPAVLFQNCHSHAEHRLKLQMFMQDILTKVASSGVSVGDRLTITPTDRQIFKDEIKFQLSKGDFAEALGLPATSVFAERIFDLGDRDQNGYMGFSEFIDVIAVLCNGTVTQKMKLLFEMYDIERQGMLSLENFTSMIRSTLEMTNLVNISEDTVKMTVQAMIDAAGISNSNSLDFEAFQKLMGHHESAAARFGLRPSALASDELAGHEAASPAKVSPNVMKRVRSRFQSMSPAGSSANVLRSGSQVPPSKIQLAGQSSKTHASTDTVDGKMISDNSSDKPKGYKSSPADAMDSSSKDTRDSSRDFSPLSALVKGYTLKTSTRHIANPDGNALTTTMKSNLNSDNLVQPSREKSRWEHIYVWFFQNRLQIFWCWILFIAFTGVFGERMYLYYFEKEHRGLRRITGLGVSVTRGAASGMMLSYSLVLLPLCRNIITSLRTTWVAHIIPFDSALAFHKLSASVGLFFAVLHCTGHAWNFYSISTQPAMDMACLLREVQWRSDFLPTFGWWCFNTVTGLTGMVLVWLLVVIYLFALPFSRHINFNLFWWTHQLYIPFYIFVLLHGAAQLVQPPIFFFYVLGPRLLFSIDKLIAYSQVTRDLPVVKATLLPSGVISLEFKKPSDFHYRSGQYVRIRCTAVSGWELHPMTLTSAPHEKLLSVHIRTLGPWTSKVRRVYQDALASGEELPPINIEGPYGHDHQDWFNYSVAVLVGGGIGVTPFVSILKDLLHQAKVSDGMRTKKVYFIWVCRTQKQFEWLVELIRTLEEEDEHGILECHIFITQLYKNFDLRTTLLYICERQFHKINNRSLFTGLQAVTHFGRPVFPSIFEQLCRQHTDETHIGVFSCGPRTLLQSVQDGVVTMRAMSKPADPILVHHSLMF